MTPAHRTPENADVLVLTNVASLVGNPYLDLWNRAVAESGARQEALSWQSALGKGGRAPEWVHLQWPERALRSRRRSRALLGGARLIAATALARVRGAKVLLTAHNVRSHQPRHPVLDRLLWRALPTLVTDLHLLSGAGAAEVLEAHPGLRRARQHVVPHGDYRPVLEAVERADGRRAVGLPVGATVLLTFGALRGYKGINELADVFVASDLPDSVLTVVGMPQDESLRARLSTLERTRADVTTELQFVEQGRLTQYLAACDGVVLPYRAVLNSGSIVLALSAGRPVLVPDTPTFQEFARRVGPGWVSCFSGALTSAALESFHASCATPPTATPDLTWCSWAAVAELLRELWSGSGDSTPVPTCP